MPLTILSEGSFIHWESRAPAVPSMMTVMKPPSVCIWKVRPALGNSTLSCLKFLALYCGHSIRKMPRLSLHFLWFESDDWCCWCCSRITPSQKRVACPISQQRSRIERSFRPWIPFGQSIFFSLDVLTNYQLIKQRRRRRRCYSACGPPWSAKEKKWTAASNTQLTTQSWEHTCFHQFSTIKTRGRPVVVLFLFWRKKNALHFDAVLFSSLAPWAINPSSSLPPTKRSPTGRVQRS